MKRKKAFQQLDDYLGTSSPVWKFSGPDNVLMLSRVGSGTEPGVRIRLNERQIEQIRRLTGVTSVLLLDVHVFGKHVDLHLVGRKVGASKWTGIAAALCDAKSVARNSMQALAFAEGIVSEVNSVVVVLDRSGAIHRFNRLAEEYTGRKQENVIGLNAQELFMSPEEAKSSRENIDRFFEQGIPYDVQRVVETANGTRSFLFRNRFIKPAPDRNAEFIVCSGIEVIDTKLESIVVQPDGHGPALNEAYCHQILRKIMDWASLVDGARALLASVEEGSGDAKELAHARRIAASAVRDAYGLYEEIDARLTQGTRQKC
jgi:PAS domain S-box-containing protein